GGAYQTTAGTYIDTLSGGASNGCDSIISTTLNVNLINTNSSSITICQGDSALIHGNYETTAGIYTQTYTNVNGCDSIEQVTLILISPCITSQIVNFCAVGSVVVNGNAYNINTIVGDIYTKHCVCDMLLSF